MEMHNISCDPSLLHCSVAISVSDITEVTENPLGWNTVTGQLYPKLVSNP